MATKIYKFLLYILPLALYFSYFPVISLGGNDTMNFELSLPLIWLVVFDLYTWGMIFIKYRSEVFAKLFGANPADSVTSANSGVSGASGASGVKNAKEVNGGKFTQIQIKTKRSRTLIQISDKIVWLLFPLFISCSVLWSLNPLRGVLTCGVVWVLFFAVVAIFALKDLLDKGFWRVWLRWLLGAALVACVWCVVQCVLDLSRFSQEVTLLCDGCVYQMFGFPHPNGWAIEPQFMGNLLIAPVMVAAGMYLKNKQSRGWWMLLLFFALSVGLFLTFSRGAIYGCVVGLIVMAVIIVVKTAKSARSGVLKRIFGALGAFALAFLFTLNLQGIMAASSPTSDTYLDGVGKVINHLSLGAIDIRPSDGSIGVEENVIEVVNSSTGVTENLTEVAENQKALQSPEVEPVENYVEKSVDNYVEKSVDNYVEKSVDNPVDMITKGQAIYDGYVSESTDTRVRLAKSAITIWKQDFNTVMFGVGLGGAGQALYDNGLSPAPKEIVQNEYASLLLETGAVGVLFFVILIIAIIRGFVKSKSAGVLLGILSAYGVTLVFFSGIPNALHIVLLPGILYLMSESIYANHKQG